MKREHEGKGAVGPARRLCCNLPEGHLTFSQSSRSGFFFLFGNLQGPFLAESSRSAKRTAQQQLLCQ